MSTSQGIVIPAKGVYEKRMRLHWAVPGAAAEITIPMIVLRKLAADVDMTVEEFLNEHDGLWRFNSFKGLHLVFPPAQARRARRRQDTSPQYGDQEAHSQREAKGKVEI
jgi:hypothetical protein